jgi:serine/threonine protein kinase
VHAHGRGVLHRDVKPENIMLVDQRCVLIDFGLADVIGDTRLTVAGLCFGSPSYLAPERLLGRVYDARADIYSLGVVLYEMLAGQRPFQGKSPREIMHARLTRSVWPLRAIRSDVSPALEAVVMRALERDPAHRFADAEQMLAALDEVPVLEELASRHAAAVRGEQEITMVTEVVSERPSLPRRLWTRLCFGSWRWRERVGAELLGAAYSDGTG